ncbi:MAG: Lrp/AsnC family transcriptional regulator [Oscillospiraceae bacterium]|nr:Lrp/AsnC family transcriptional regulator [Oscillospiraceae bacterium]
MNDKLLALLEQDCTLSTEQLAALCDRSEEEIRAAIEELEEQHVILGYHAAVDWARTDREDVTALIEVQVMPQRGRGFDRVAERIWQFDEVESLYLMSGSYDLACIVTGKTLREVARFVSEHLSALEDVTGTATHFILKRYKDKHVIYETKTVQEEGFVFS